MSGIAKSKKNIICLVALGILVISPTVLAVDWPPSPGFGTTLDADSSDLSTLIKYFYEWAVSLGGLAVFIVLVFAGFQYLTSAGNPAQITEAKGRMQSAAFGLVLLLGSVLILNTINPELTTFKPLVLPEPSQLLGNCEFYYEIDPETGERKEPPIQRSLEEANQYCKDNFGEDYECKDDVCTIDLAKLFEVVNCDSVFIRIDGGETTIPMGGRTTAIELGPEKGFELQANPPDGEKQCMANLMLYEGTGWWGGCAGDKRTLAIQPGTVSYNAFAPIEGVDISVKCIELEKI